jgi:hypothetical protein
MGSTVESLESRWLLSATAAVAAADAVAIRGELAVVLADVSALKRIDAAELKGLTAEVKQSGQLKAEKALLSNLGRGQKFDLNHLSSYSTALATPTKQQVNKLVGEYKGFLRKPGNARVAAKVLADASALETRAFAGQQTLSLFASFADSGPEIQELGALAAANATDAAAGSAVSAATASLQSSLATIQRDSSVVRSGVVALAADAQPAVAGAVTFSDSTFSDNDWTASDINTATATNSFTAGQVPSGGNPGPYRSVTLNWSNQGDLGDLSQIISVASLNSQAVYDPATSGAIATISYSMDAMETSSDNSAGVYEELVLYQNGTYFVPLANQYVTQTGDWSAIAQSGLTSSAFTSGTAPHPDFSAQGAPIEFGYMSITGNTSVSAGQHQNVVATDNWSVTVNPVTH